MDNQKRYGKIYPFPKRRIDNMALDTAPKTVIKPTEVTDEKYIKEILEEAYSKPSEKAIDRNIKALRLLQKLRG